MDNSSTDFIVRKCEDKYIPIINGERGGRTFYLYRGERYDSIEQAWTRLLDVWENEGTGNVRLWKQNPQAY